jgi:hypothetical protein
MFETVDDLLPILTTAIQNQKPKVNLIHKHDDLTQVFGELKSNGYHGIPSYNAGIITNIYATFDVGGILPVQVNIQAQRPTKHSIETTVLSDTAETFNKQMKARLEFNKHIIKKEYLSSYSEEDLQILNNCRSISNCCKLEEPTKEIKSHLMCMDINKAFTYQLSRITEVPLFNEFDKFTPYDNHKIEKHNLY